jgi:hypothetical protein
MNPPPYFRVFAALNAPGPKIACWCRVLAALSVFAPWLYWTWLIVSVIPLRWMPAYIGVWLGLSILYGVVHWQLRRMSLRNVRFPRLAWLLIAGYFGMVLAFAAWLFGGGLGWLLLLPGAVGGLVACLGLIQCICCPPSHHQSATVGSPIC